MGNPGDGSVEHKERDWWDKAEIIFKIFAAVIVTAITIVGSYFVNKQQDANSNNQLYSQFISEREKAENEVRKDMFDKVLGEFWKNSSDNTCVLDTINRQLLQLELISRNFHETLDLSPLFTDVLLTIVKNLNHRKFKWTEVSRMDACTKKVYRRLLRKGNVTDKDAREYIKNLKDHKRNQLIRIARRITVKQMESLSDVVQRIRLTVNLKQTCQDTRPNQKFKTDNESCDKAFDKDGNLYNVAKASQVADNEDYSSCEIINNDAKEGEATTTRGIRLSLHENGTKTAERCFYFAIKHSYPRWSNVYVDIKTNRYPAELSADRNGKSYIHNNFWVSFFDFPLADNTYLSNKERFSVVLEKLDEEKGEAKLSLLYFPASYAGFKEKAFFQQRMLNSLMSK